MISSKENDYQNKSACLAKCHTSCSIAKHISSDVKIFPDNECFDGAQLKGFESVINSKAVPAGVLADLVKILLYKSLFLYKFHVGQRLGSKFDSQYTKGSVSLSEIL